MVDAGRQNSADSWCSRGLVVTVSGPGESQFSVRVRRPFARIGSDQRAEVSLPQGDLLPCHLYLHATEQGIYCLGLADAAPSGWLAPKVRVELGPYRIKAAFDDAGPPPTAGDTELRKKGCPPGPAPRLKIDDPSDNQAPVEVALDRQLSVIGRRSPSSFRLGDKSVSRVHCAAYWSGDALWAIDLLSGNGTLLDEQRIDAAVWHPGQELTAGCFRMQYLRLHPPLEVLPAAVTRTTTELAVVGPNWETAEPAGSASLIEDACRRLMLAGPSPGSLQVIEHELSMVCLTLVRASQTVRPASSPDVDRLIEAIRGLEQRLAQLALANGAGAAPALVGPETALLPGPPVAAAVEATVEPTVAEQPPGLPLEAPAPPPTAPAACQAIPAAEGGFTEAPAPPPTAPAAPRSILDDRMLERLVNFKSKRERKTQRRKLVWSAAAAVALVLTIAITGAAKLLLRPEKQSESLGRAPADERAQRLD